MSRATIPDEPLVRAATSWTPGTEIECHAVRQQLKRILEHTYFKNSRRYPTLLRYIVEHALKGETHLKERVLGVEVFGRDPNYDTNEDPIVRIAAGEVRKRIAQYYHEPGHIGELRIDLPPGSYTPIYHLPENEPPPEVVRTAQGTLPSAGEFSHPVPLKQRSVYIYFAVSMVLLASVLIAWIRSSASAGPLEELWGPLLHSKTEMLLCMGEANSSAQTAEPTVSDFLNTENHVTFAEASAVFRVGKFLTSQGMTTRLQPANATTLRDLRRFPIVLIGGSDNPWTLRITQPLRFHFVAPSSQTPTMIEDRSNPSQKDWSINLGQKYSQLTRDYAIVARFFDPTTAQPVVVAAGLGENGTLAAAQFLAEAKFAKDLTKAGPSGWKDKNVEIVITTEIVDGQAGPPQFCICAVTA